LDRAAPRVDEDGTAFCTVQGIFYRAVDPAYPEFALSGSRAAGRFSPPDVPTLYLSSSREGVAAAMIAHADTRAANLEVLAFDVHASCVADLRDRNAMSALGIDVEAAAAPWQAAVVAGRTPASWRVREGLEQLGARGLIDPSRKRPELWHLTLFAWNHAGEPSVHPL
jgi:RES domain-containing protein